MKLWRGVSWRRRAAVVSGASAVVLLLALVLGYVTTTVPQPSSVATSQGVQLLYADGSPMAHYGTNRVLVPLDQVSLAAQHAVLAAEDRGFYSEPGISIKGILRALFANVRAGGVSQGGSTITQQYAKNAFLTQKRTFTRKIREVFIALKMSQTVSKNQILEDYLNTIYFGRGAFGIEAAARTYFKTSAAKLTVAQGAVLASSIRSPAGYDPARHLTQAQARWRYVLDGMVKSGWLTPAARAAAVYPKVQPRTLTSANDVDLDHIRDQVIAELQKHGFPEDQIAAGGLVVTTTIDHTAQDAARAAVAAQLQAINAQLRSGKKPDPVEAALAAVEPGTGKVVAYYGGNEPGGFDYADEGTGVQPGSSMKPYVLATALSQGKTLGTKYDGSTPQTVCGTVVHNDAGDPPFHQVDLATALAFSVNTVYTRLACDVGPQKVADLAHAAGITTKLAGEGVLSTQIALGAGGYEVHPLDHANGYATFADGGAHVPTYFVQKVSDARGNVIYQARAGAKTQAFSATVAADATYAMQQVVLHGTGVNAQLPGRPTAGKTGTSSENRNAWFCGFTPQLATAVWIGHHSGAPLTNLPGYPGGVYGGAIPAKIFHDFMTAALQGKPVLPFPASLGTAPSPTPTPSVSPTPSATPHATATPTPSSSPTAGLSLPPILTSPTASPSPSPSPTKASPTP